MKCFHCSDVETEEGFSFEGVFYALRECDSREEAAVRKALEELWYLKESSVSYESSGGWSGSSSDWYVCFDFSAKNAVLSDGAVIGFCCFGEDVHKEIAARVFFLKDEGVSLPSTRVKTYSFDGGDGDGVTHYSYSLCRKDPEFADFENRYCFLLDRKGELTREKVFYNMIRRNEDGTVGASRNMKFFHKGILGIPEKVWPDMYVSLIEKE